MAGRIEGKVCIITGGTSGIGRAAVELFAEEGGKIVFAGRRSERGEAVEKELREKGYDVTFVRADVSCPDDLKKIVDTAVGKYGRIDVVYNNAGTTGRFPLCEATDAEEIDRIFNTNIRSVIILNALALQDMMKRGSGSIINTSSPASVMGVPLQGIYAATKGGINAYTKTLALEQARTGIRVNAIIPGLIDTEMIDPEEVEKRFLDTVPMHTIGTGRDVAKAALFFASDDSSYCTGSILAVDGGIISA